MSKDIRFQMTYRERALMHIISKLWAGSITHWFDSAPRRKADPCKIMNAGFDPTREPRPGDLVLCQSNTNHFAGVAIYVKAINRSSGCALLQSLGSDDLMEMGNESYMPITGIDLDNPIFYYGDQRAMYEKILKAFVRGGEYLYRFGGAKFEGSKVTITIRPHIFVQKAYEPFSATMEWGKRTTIKAILAAMVDAGYGVALENVQPPSTGETTEE